MRGLFATMGEDDESSADRPGSHDGSTFDGVLQEIARAPFREPPPTAQVADPEQIAHFRIEGRLGQGAMGIVFRARDTSLNRIVALKVLPGGFERDEARRARFLREARAAAALNHPNLAAVYEVGQADGRIYIAMEHVPGQSLRQLLAERRPSVDDSLRIARQIAAALAHAHAAGVIHRDLKPDNVMIGSNGVVKVLDFGLAKVQPSGDGSSGETDTETEAGQVMGTPAYMAPEQWRGSQVTAAADVFAFGVMLFEMLTGERPFRGATRGELLQAVGGKRITRASSRNPAVPATVDAIVCDCLIEAPERRIADGSALEDRLPLASHTVERAPGFRAARTRPAVVALFAALAAVLVWVTMMEVRRASVGAAAAPGASSTAALVVARGPGDAGQDTMSNPPIPRTKNPEALRHYLLAMAAYRGVSIGTCGAELALALTLDPTFAAAHLRSTMFEFTSGLGDALRYRDSLDERDQAILHAYEPMELEVPANLPETLRRLTALSEQRPYDVEILSMRGDFEGNIDPEKARATMSRALELDPGMAVEEYDMAWLAIKTNDFPRAQEHLARCLAIAPDASTCMRHSAKLQGRLGRCDDFAEGARKAVILAPGDYFAQMMLVTAMLTKGATRDEVTPLIDQALSSPIVVDAPPPRATLATNSARRAVAFWFGNVEEARKLSLDEGQQQRPLDANSDFDLAERLAVLEEVGRERDLLPAVHRYMTLRGTLKGRVDGAALRLLREAGDEAELEKVRADWLRAPQQGGLRTEKDHFAPAPDLTDWLEYYGADALTPADAREALAAQARFQPVPVETLYANQTEELGRIFLLADRPHEAIAPLEDAAHTCEVIEFSRYRSFVAPIVRARYELGLAQEALGNPAAACAAYASVLERWGHATPRSKTADLTRARMKALACPPPPP